MIPQQLTAVEHEIRKAIARRQHSDLPQKLEDLRRVADGHMAALPAGDPLRREIARRMLATIRWATTMLVTQRQTAFEELERLPKVGRYLDRTHRRPPALSLDL